MAGGNRYNEGDFYRPSPREKNHHSPQFSRSGPPHRDQPKQDRDNGFTFRGAAGGVDSYRPSGDRREAFTFRSARPRPSSAPRPGLADRIPRKPHQPAKQRLWSGQSTGAHRHRYKPDVAYKRDLMVKIQHRETTPEQLPGMNDDANMRFENIDEAFAADTEPVAKHLKVENAPKWSNPDMETVLAADNIEGSRKDIVQSIRLAKRQAEQDTHADSAVQRNADYISFNFDDDDEYDSASPPPAKRAKKSNFREDYQGGTKIYFDDDTDNDSDRRRYGPHDPFRGNGAAMAEAWEPLPDVDDITPWFKDSLKAETSPTARLRQELGDFYDYVKPREADNAVRQDLISRIMKLLQSHHLLKDEEIEVHGFGSFAAGLYLPDADMDLVVLSSSYIEVGEHTICQTQKHIRKIADYIMKSGIAAQGSVLPIIFARVPLIKFVDQVTGLKVDISFENASGLRAISNVLAWQKEFPCMLVLISFVKQLLALYGYNEVHTGGIGGFTTICLVVSYLQNLEDIIYRDEDPEEVKQHNADLVMGFLAFYGAKFDHRSEAIMMNPPGYRGKGDDRLPRCRDDRLTVIDPNDDSNDLSGGAFKTAEICALFRLARSRIMDRLDDIRNKKHSGSTLDLVFGANYTAYRRQRVLVDEAYANVLAAGGAPPVLKLPDLSKMQRPGARILRAKKTLGATKGKRKRDAR